MTIPRTTTKARFYVATSEDHAFSSWDTLEEAVACINRFHESGDPNADQIRGVLQTGPTGRIWVDLPVICASRQSSTVSKPRDC